MERRWETIGQTGNLSPTDYSGSRGDNDDYYRNDTYMTLLPRRPFSIFYLIITVLDDYGRDNLV